MGTPRAWFKWKSDPKPTGPYASFQRRSWPTMYTNNRQMDVVADIVDLNGDGYEGYHAKRTDLRLKVRLYLTIDGQQVRKLSKSQFGSIAECKEWVKLFFDKNPNHIPGGNK